MTDTKEGSRQLIGQVVAGRYEVKEKLGEGGMSEVYLGADKHLEGMSVAIKLLKLDDSAILKRFNEEAKGQILLGEHPNICGVRERVHEQGKLKYIVMDFVPGESLFQFMRRNEGNFHNPSIRNLLIQIIMEVSLTLHYAHTTPIPKQKVVGIIHRDLKPENIMLHDLGGGRLSPVLVDFGLCRIGQGVGYTSDSRVFGTPHYASIEQLLYPTKVTHLTDIFSTGMILYGVSAEEGFYAAAKELTPFGIVDYYRKNYENRMQLIRDPMERAIVEKSTAENPEDRYQTAEELAQALQNLLEEKNKAEGVRLPVSQSMTLNYASKKPSSQRLATTVGDKPPDNASEKTTKHAKKAPKVTLLLTAGNTKVQRKKSKVPPLALLLVAATLLLGGGGYFLFRGNSEPAKKKSATSSMKKTQNMTASMKKEVAQRQKQTKNGRALGSENAKMPKVQGGKTKKEPTKSAKLKALQLFEKWDSWCRQHNRYRSLFKDTPSLHSDCIRNKKAQKYIRKKKEYEAGKEIVALLKRKFCTFSNYKKDRNMKKECLLIAKFLQYINHWQKIDDCQKALNNLLRAGKSDEKDLPRKCIGIRGFFNPQRRVAPYCQRLYRRTGEKGLPPKCKPLLKAFPALFQKS